MQLVKRINRRASRVAELMLAGGAALLLAGAVGCSGAPSQSASVTPRPLEGTSLKFSCSDDRLRALLEPMIRVWSHRTGAQVEVAKDRMSATDAFDFGVIPFAELGSLANRGDLAPIPAALREPGHAYQWSSVLSVYRGEAYAGWGTQVFGLPIAADGHLLVYRADRFADPQTKEEFLKRVGRPLSVPATWEEFADVAAYFAEKDKRPSLPCLAADAERLEDLFMRIAACYDRPVRTGEGEENPESLAFQFRLDTGKARLGEKGFGAAGRWLASLKERGCTADGGSADPAEALVADRAVMAVLAMPDLARLKRDGTTNARYGIAPLPGTAATVNPITGALAPTKLNYVPYFSGGWLGVVRRTGRNPDAAFALLVELGGPARSQEVVSAGGFGPLRDTHLEADHLLMWLGYGFDDARSKALQEALRSCVGKSVRNPTLGLRTPDRETLSRGLRAELLKVASGTAKPEEGLKRVAEEWDRGSAEAPREKLLEWRRRAAGLN